MQPNVAGLGPPGRHSGFRRPGEERPMPPQRLLFEREIYEMEDLLAKLEAGANGQMSASDEVRRMRRELVHLKRKIYSDLSPWQTVEVSRHPERPQTLD